VKSLPVANGVVDVRGLEKPNDSGQEIECMGSKGETWEEGMGMDRLAEYPSKVGAAPVV